MIFYYNYETKDELYIVEKINDKSFSQWQTIKIIKRIIGYRINKERFQIHNPSFMLHRGMYEIIEQIFEKGK